MPGERQYTDDELRLFAVYRQQRIEGTVSIREQKRHAEQMLCILRPAEAQVYELRQQGFDLEGIARKLRIGVKRARGRRDVALAWLRRALIDVD